MNVQRAPLQFPLSIHDDQPNTFGGFSMSLATVKNAAITTATVLAVMYVLNQISATRPLVQKAIGVTA
jgi:hypothetical protein